jgi:hypothetical protein
MALKNIIVLFVCQRSWDLLKSVGKVNLVREGRNQTLLYTLGNPADFSRNKERSQKRSAAEKCLTSNGDEQHSVSCVYQSGS